MSVIEGVGDEVVAFTVVLLVLILAATVTFLLNSSPFTDVRSASISDTTLIAPSEVNVIVTLIFYSA